MPLGTAGRMGNILCRQFSQFRCCWLPFRLRGTKPQLWRHRSTRVHMKPVFLFYFLLVFLVSFCFVFLSVHLYTSVPFMFGRMRRERREDIEASAKTFSGGHCILRNKHLPESRRKSHAETNLVELRHSSSASLRVRVRKATYCPFWIRLRPL